MRLGVILQLQEGDINLGIVEVPETSTSETVTMPMRELHPRAAGSARFHC